jgi:hypothetical protein
MPVRTLVGRAAQPLSAFDFHWDVETEILAGRSLPPGADDTDAVAWEFEGPDGAVVVLETVDGTLCGIEVVVWPDVERARSLIAPHDAPPGTIGLVPPADGADGIVEIETVITAAAPPSETLIHLSFGVVRARSVRVAENVVADLDAEGRLAGLWLQDLPLFPGGG